MAERELPGGGVRLRGNDAVPLMLACRTVAKAAAKLAVDPESNEAEAQVREIDGVVLCLGLGFCWGRGRGE